VKAQRDKKINNKPQKVKVTALHNYWTIDSIYTTDLITLKFSHTKIILLGNRENHTLTTCLGTTLHKSRKKEMN